MEYQRHLLGDVNRARVAGGLAEIYVRSPGPQPLRIFITQNYQYWVFFGSAFHNFMVLYAKRTGILACFLLNIEDSRVLSAIDSSSSTPCTCRR